MEKRLGKRNTIKMRNSCLTEKKEWSKQEWVDMDFDKWIYEIAQKRYGQKKDKRLLSFRIITRSILKISIIKEIENILISAQIKDDRWENEE